MAFASGSFAGASTGDAQSSLYVLRNVTTNTTPTELFLDGTAARMQVPTDSMWTFDILVAGRTQLLNPPDSRVISGAYHIRGVILRQGDATQLLSSTNTVLHADIPAWSASAVADDTHQALIIRVVGGAGDAPVRWVASVRTAEVVFP